MNFKLKTLVVALALAATAGQASAALSLPTATTPSDAIFYAFDLGSGNSYAFDHGSVAGLSSIGSSWSVTGNSAWDSFVEAEGGVLDSVTWGVAYNQGNSLATSLWGTTVTNDPDMAIGNQTGGKMNAGRAVLNNFFNTTSLTGAGTSAFYSGTGAANMTTSFKNTWGANAAGWTTDNVVGSTANFYTVTQATSAAGGVFVSQLAFDGSALSVAAPVPEPETYGMLLAGLLTIGAIARRRQA